MKKYLIPLLSLLFLSACEDVVEIDTPTEAPRLFVDGVIRIDAAMPSTTVSIKVGLTSSFFESTESAAGAEVIIRNESYTGTDVSDENFMVLSENFPGVYEGTKNTDFFTTGELQLTIGYDDQVYSATTSYVPAVPIDKLEQGDGSLFTGDEIEIVVAFTDAPERDDYYLFDFDFNEYLVTEDAFYQGQTFEFSYFYDDGVDSGREISISLIGVDHSLFNYMNQVIVQAGAEQGPFQTPSATVRGNIINITDPENIDGQNNFALGYFAVCQTYTKTITIE
ncbi:DUF4249 family protein [Pseudozobellia thermophila]|uniref:DUF4249 domain-containing protein n=1 Tax=Pseudozobellia thermophila TaxID=192903 RepID=A0A1M6FCG9_9FLAO|nr:DUF4249 family protein [Pseudozobellia thermophila]SHI95343.1 protein of unknown function [Pseudozobellia thermophila]